MILVPDRWLTDAQLFALCRRIGAVPVLDVQRRCLALETTLIGRPVGAGGRG